MATYRLVFGGAVTDRTVQAASAPSLAANKGYWAQETNNPPSFDPATQYLVGPTWTATPPAGGNEGTVVANYTVSSIPVADRPAVRKAKATADADAKVRQERELQQIIAHYRKNGVLP